VPRHRPHSQVIFALNADSLVCAHLFSHSFLLYDVCHISDHIRSRLRAPVLTLILEVTFLLKPGPYQLVLIVHIRTHCIMCATSPVSPIALARACAHPFSHSFSQYRLPPPVCFMCNTRQCLLARNGELCHSFTSLTSLVQHLSSYSCHNTHRARHKAVSLFQPTPTSSHAIAIASNFLTSMSRD